MNPCRWFAALLVFSGVVAVPALVAAMHPAGQAEATVCVSAGRRISVSGCTDIGDNMRYVPPPAAYAPLPEDETPPPPPPP